MDDELLFQDDTLSVSQENEEAIERITQDRETLEYAYFKVFSGQGDKDSADKVMKDLRDNCFGDRITFNADPRIHAYNEGMRSVLLHIQSFSDPNNLTRIRK